MGSLQQRWLKHRTTGRSPAARAKGSVLDPGEGRVSRRSYRAPPLSCARLADLPCGGDPRHKVDWKDSTMIRTGPGNRGGHNGKGRPRS